MKILNAVAVILILGSMFNIFLFRIVPLNFIELTVSLLIGVIMLGLNLKYMDKQDKIKKGKQI